jgi:hypothetical protein
MVCDEAPAATIGGFNGKRNVTARKSVGWERRVQFLRSGPTSLVAAEIHLGLKASGICNGWLRCNIQVVCHADVHKISCKIKQLSPRFGTVRDDAVANFEQAA